MSQLPSIAELSLPIKVGQLVMSGIDGTTCGDDAQFVIDELKIGNIIMMGRNVESPHQMLQLTKDLQSLADSTLGLPLLIATDQEGGRVQRLNAGSGFLRMPTPATVGTSNDLDLVRRFAQAVGDEVRAVGLHAVFAPVLDVNDNSENPVIGRLRRSLGETPERVSPVAKAFIQGLHDAGVLSGGKHFPGHGCTSKDSHFELPTVEKSRVELEATELQPFRDAVAHGIDMLLTAHVTYPHLDPTNAPATLSRPILTDVLRDELGFKGLIVTDGMEMDGITRHIPIGEAAVQAVEAGVDIVLCVRQHPDSDRGREVIIEIRNALLSAAESGRISEDRIDQSLHRILEIKRTIADKRPPSIDIDLVGGDEQQQVLSELLASVDPAAIEADESGPSLVDRLTYVTEEIKALFRDLTDRATPSRGPLD